MIKEKYLVPGRVLGRLTDGTRRYPNKHDENGDPIAYWRPCMVVAYYPDVNRRHSRKTAPVNGWEVLVIWMGDDTTKPVEHVRIPSDHAGWKLLW